MTAVVKCKRVGSACAASCLVVKHHFWLALHTCIIPETLHASHVAVETCSSLVLSGTNTFSLRRQHVWVLTSQTLFRYSIVDISYAVDAIRHLACAPDTSPSIPDGVGYLTLQADLFTSIFIAYRTIRYMLPAS